MKRRNLSLAQRKRLLDEIPQVAEGLTPPGVPLWIEAGGNIEDVMQFFAGSSATQIILQAGFDKFDDLPKQIRRALYDAVVTFDPRPVAEYVSHSLATKPRKTVVSFVVRAIHQQERADIAEFAQLHLRKHRYRLPHIAARASILRYDARTLLLKRRTKRHAATTSV